MKRLYVTDLDGTLLDKSSHISKDSADIINMLIKEGILFTYATARSNNSSVLVTQGLDINLPIIIFNGAFIYDPIGSSFLHKVTFTDRQIKNLLSFTKKYSYTPLIYTFINGEQKVLWNCNGSLSEGFYYYLSKRKNDTRMMPVNSVEESFCGEIFYITFIENHNDLLPLYDDIKGDKDYNTVFQQELYREEYWCEIMPQSATKANAVKRLKEILGCEQLIVFGDSLNDVPMFEIADKAYAVKNANDRLKELATEIIGYNYENSVAKKILELEGK